MTYEFEATYEHEDGYIEVRAIGCYESAEDAAAAAFKLNGMWLRDEPYMKLIGIEIRKED